MENKNINKVRSGFLIIAFVTGTLAIQHPFFTIISGSSLIAMAITYINKDY